MTSKASSQGLQQCDDVDAILELPINAAIISTHARMFMYACAHAHTRIYTTAQPKKLLDKHKAPIVGIYPTVEILRMPPRVYAVSNAQIRAQGIPVNCSDDFLGIRKPHAPVHATRNHSTPHHTMPHHATPHHVTYMHITHTSPCMSLESCMS